MTCIIIDDDSSSRLILNQLCSEMDNLNVISEFSNAMQAIKFLNNSEVDLIFLDIHMPEFSGFDLLQTLKNPPKVILITSDDSLALNAFDYDCIVDYIVKPIVPQRLEKAYQKAKSFTVSGLQNKNQLNSSNNTNFSEFYINIDRTLIKIQTGSVKIIMAKGDYIIIKTNDKEYQVHSTLKKIASKLPEEHFLQVHRSYIINLSKIIDIQDNSILIDQSVIPISRSKKPELLRRLDLL